MADLRAIWRMARLGVLGLAVAGVVGLAAHPAAAHWRWNGYTYVWVATLYYPPGYYYPPADYDPPPPAYDYSPPPTVSAPLDYGPSIGFGFRIH